MRRCSPQHARSSTPLRWQSLTENLLADLLWQAPREGEWSAMECLYHLCLTERDVFPIRVRAFLDGQDIPSYNPDQQEPPNRTRTPGWMAAEFARLRAESLLLLGHVCSADLVRTSIHAELGQVSLNELLHEWAAHDLNHTIQAEQNLMQPFIVGSGPWRFYFKAHDQG